MTATRAALCLWLAAVAGATAAPVRLVQIGADGKLAYAVDERGNRALDFSHAGYGGGGVAVPDVPVRVVVEAKAGDSTARIQAAIDHVSARKPDARGLRGAVLLRAGRHEVVGALRVTAGGVVLRGEKGAVLVAAGTDRRTLIQIKGKADRQLSASYTVAERYVPTGAAVLRMEKKGLRVGDTVVIEHPSTAKWIAALGMNRFPTDGKGSWLDWRPGTLDVRWDRVVTRVDGDRITLDAPLTMALDADLARCTVTPYSWPGRISHVGIENLRLESAYDRGNPRDEEHAWGGVGIENALNVWVRQVTFAHFAGSAVAVWQGCKWVSVEDCAVRAPISEVGGQRRHTFYTAGELTLFRRCTAEHGRHDFAVGYLAAGPNAFVDCRAKEAQQFSGPIESWATGVLYDNVTMDGGGLALTNRETDAHGVGWAAANSLLWNCVGPTIVCRRPPTANNWAVGCWGPFTGDGGWQSMNSFVKPDSLYQAQLSERLGADTARPRPVPTTVGGAKGVEEMAPQRIRELSQRPVGPAKPLALKGGWLLCGGELLHGGRLTTAWWRGVVLPGRATEVGVGLTRFVPGRVGPGFTDDLDELTDSMRANQQAVLSHHWGLWYDRRRDDHQMVRRADAGVWAPFYELPWARSGRGRAWDGLSKYDLTKFNPWYFGRLRAFAERCEGKGLLLAQQMYFQHNILEAGAHWADFPWRPANCLQATGFPEPPPYVNRKRVFMAETFYDVSHPLRRQLHRRYIRHCLDVLGGCPNVVYFTGEEFTGPLPFVRFWLDTIAEWQKETRRKVLVGLSCTKDVQDAILADPVRGPLVSVIDLKYWWYTANGGVYDPRGGQNLAPRQQLREWKGSKSRSDASVARQIREYRSRYPDKAVICSLDGVSGWAVVAAGGSVPKLPVDTDRRLLAALPTMKPFTAKTLTAQQWAVAEPGKAYLVYSAAGESIRLPLSAAGGWSAWWVEVRSGRLSPAAGQARGKEMQWRNDGSRPAVLWVTMKGAN